jgi:hypothetical protein
MRAGNADRRRSAGRPGRNADRCARRCADHPGSDRNADRDGRRRCPAGRAVRSPRRRRRARADGLADRWHRRRTAPRRRRRRAGTVGRSPARRCPASAPGRIRRWHAGRSGSRRPVRVDQSRRGATDRPQARGSGPQNRAGRSAAGPQNRAARTAAGPQNRAARTAAGPRVRRGAVRTDPRRECRTGQGSGRCHAAARRAGSRERFRTAGRPTPARSAPGRPDRTDRVERTPGPRPGCRHGGPEAGHAEAERAEAGQADRRPAGRCRVVVVVRPAGSGR